MKKSERDEAKKKLLELIREGAPLTRACKKVGIHRDTCYDWQQTDPEFALALGHAKRMNTEETDEAAEFWMSKWVREGDRKSVYKWLDARHPSFRKRNAVTLAIKDPQENYLDEEGVPVDMTKEDFFNIMRAWELVRGANEFENMPPKLARDFAEWKVKFPRGTR